MNVQEAVLQFLAAEGVDTVFSLMAEDNMGFTVTIEEDWSDRIDLVETRHEQLAVGLADGYSRATDDIGVSIVGRGPAVAQTGTGLVTARKNDSDLLVIVPETPLGASSDIKGFNQEAYLETMIGEVRSVRSTEMLVPTFDEVFRRLRSGRGPIAVQIPWDLLDESIELPDDWRDSMTIGSDNGSPSGARLTPDLEDVETAVDLYLESDASVHAIVLAGRGAVKADAKAAIRKFAEKTGALLATTVQGHGLFSDHPFGVGFVGTFGTNLANEYLTQSDYVLAVGCSLNEHTTDHGRLVDEATVVHVDVDPVQIGALTEVDLGIVGDATATVEAMTELLDEMDINFADKFWTENTKRRIAEAAPLDQGEFPDVDGSADPRTIIKTLDPILPAERNIVTDAGHFMNWVLDGMAVPDSTGYEWTSDFGSIGIGVPISLGMAKAHGSDRMTVLFCGDAGWTMSMQTVDTAVRYDIPVLMFVMNDGALGSEYQQLKSHNLPPDAAVVEAPDIAALAEDFGAEAYSVSSAADLEEISDKLDHTPDGPIVVDCKINRDVRHRFYDTGDEVL